jgi:heme-degrading monooxygenase HmoA
LGQRKLRLPFAAGYGARWPEKAKRSQPVISRQWRGIARRSEADGYVSHLRSDTFPQLGRIQRFCGASILRRDVAAGVEFLIVTLWESIDAVRAFAGDNPEEAVVPDRVREMMVSFDRIVSHYAVVE